MNECSPCSFTVSRLLDRFSTVKSIIPKAACWLKVVLIQTSALSHNLVLCSEVQLTNTEGPCRLHSCVPFSSKLLISHTISQHILTSSLEIHKPKDTSGASEWQLEKITACLSEEALSAELKPHTSDSRGEVIPSRVRFAVWLHYMDQSTEPQQNCKCSELSSA